MHRPLARLSTLGAALTAAVMLCACSPGDGPGAPPPAAPAVRDESLARDLERIERAARARPAVLEQELRARGDKLPPGSAAELEVLALRGLLAAYARDRALADQMAQRLREWPAGELHAAAAVAAASISAEYLRSHGDLREARKLLLDVDSAQLNAAAPVIR